jgi:uncharacterized protein (DUF433 family)
MMQGPIHDRGRGPEIEGTRITVYNLLPHFLDAETTEASICDRYDLTPEQVGAARAYVLRQPDVVLERYMMIEARMASGNPPEVLERAEKARAALLRFKEWLAGRELDETRDQAHENKQDHTPSAARRPQTFNQWLAEKETQSVSGM